MKKIFFLVGCLFIYSFTEESFILDPSRPIEIGVTSIDNNSNYLLSVYMINHQPVSGIQFDLEPQNFFVVDTVYGGRAEKNGFSLHYNKSGRILGFSLSGSVIPESKSLNKEDNILFEVLVTPLSNTSLLDTFITIIPIFSDGKAQRIDYISIPFEIGK